MRRLLAVGFALVLTAALPFAKQAAVGSADLSGVVVTTDAQPAPVRRAVVTLRDDGTFVRSAISGERGEFEFRGLPAGRYTLTASRPAFVTATYGARRPGRPGTPLSIAAGQHLADVRLYMARGAAISGTVRDPQGRPAPNVEVLVRPVGALVEAGILDRGADQIATDDRGQYRAFGLSPGAYVVVALPRVLQYSVTELRAMTPAEIDAALRQLQTRRSQPAAAPPADSRSGPRRTYMPVFHPGTTSQSDASAIVVNAGDDVIGIDVPLTLVSSISIEGRVVRPDGAPATGTQVIISGAGGGMPVDFMRSAPVLSLRPGPDGRFKYTNVAAGAYVLMARTQDGLWARTQFVAGGDDLSGVTLTVQPGLSFNGEIRFDASTLPPPQNLTRRIWLYPPGLTGGGVAVSNGTSLGVRVSAFADAGPDGRFEITGILPGSYTLATSVPTGWWLRSAIVDGRDVLDEIIAVDRSVSGAVVTFSDRHTELSGVLQTPAGLPAVEYFVIVCSADRRHWFAGSRRTKTARPGSDGRYVFADLPPGDYVVAALEDVDPQQLADSALLEGIVASGTKVRIAEGGKAQLDLKIVR